MTRLDRHVPLLDIYSSMDRRDTVFLDSSMRNGLGRKSYIGMLPFRIRTPEDSDAIDVLNGIGDDDTLMGFLSYDYGMRLHGIGTRHGDPLEPLFILADFDIVIVEDHDSNTLDVKCRGRVTDAESEMGIVDDILNRAAEPSVPEGCGYEVISDTPREDFIGSVEEAREMMRKGEFYVVNITRRMEVRSGSDPFDAFLRLRSISPSPFGAYMDLLGMQVISSSMELLLDCVDGAAHTRPIKGTSKRTGNAEEDGESLRWLLASEKDRSELLMVTDMERNDMNRFCIPGSVRVESFFHPEEYSTLYHTVADVTGRVGEDIGIGDMVACMFPGGSIAGAPKDACMDAIDALERTGRGLYTGSIGMFSKERTVMNITIRTMVHRNGVYSMGVGGGITYESDPVSEYEETVQKGKAMLRSLQR